MPESMRGGVVSSIVTGLEGCKICRDPGFRRKEIETLGDKRVASRDQAIYMPKLAEDEKDSRVCGFRRG